MENKFRLGPLLYSVKQELLAAQREHAGELSMFRLRQLEVELAVEFEAGTSAEFNIWVVKVTPETKYTGTHTIKVTFDAVKPPPPSSKADESFEAEADATLEYGEVVIDEPSIKSPPRVKPGGLNFKPPTSRGGGPDLGRPPDLELR